MYESTNFIFKLGYDDDVKIFDRSSNVQLAHISLYAFEEHCGNIYETGFFFNPQWAEDYARILRDVKSLSQ
jgi:hypothetical protein